MELGLSVYTELLYWGKKTEKCVFWQFRTYVCVYFYVCVSECVDGGGDREYEVKKKI